LSLVPGPDLSLRVEGPTATGAGAVGDNLVLRAARNLLQRHQRLRLGAFHLVKRLPAAAGMGGGSSDAAAALRLLGRLNKLKREDPAVLAAARATGADVPVCLAARARIMSGIGDRLGEPVALPRLFAVLVNPGIAIETAQVFAALGLASGQQANPVQHPLVNGTNLLDCLASTRNDLEPPARKLAPSIGEALALLSASPDCRLARMSGSGATVFGLFDDCAASAANAKRIRHARPNWWVKPTVLR
jgi:4-diphosphocytidyl-2-C-methyl-D-erythritol kinase